MHDTVCKLHLVFTLCHTYNIIRIVISNVRVESRIIISVCMATFNN